MWLYLPEIARLCPSLISQSVQRYYLLMDKYLLDVILNVMDNLLQFVQKELSEGVTDFLALAVAGGPKDKTPDDFCQPCGVCRQVLMQYCPGDMPVFVVKNEQEIQNYTLRQLLPYAWQRKRGIEE